MSSFSSAEAAEQLGVSRNTLLRWFREGRISPVGRDRRGWRCFSKADLERIRSELGEVNSRPRQASSKMRAYLRRVPSLCRLTDTVLDELSSCARFRGFLAGQMFFSPGDRSSGLHILVKGKIKVFRSSPHGREQVLTVVTPYQTLGEAALFREDERHSSFAMCVESSTVMSLPLARVRELTQQYPQLALAFLREFGSRIADLEQRLGDLAMLSLDQRLARLLLQSVDSEDQVQLALPLAELASMLGVARETLSRALVRLERQGLIDRRERTLLLLDPQGLAAL